VRTGVPVRAAFQSVSKAAVAPSGVEVVTMDYNQPQTLRAALQGVDRVFLVGPPTSELPAMERRVVDEIKRMGTVRIVNLSAMGGRGAIFPRQHADSEDYIKASGLPYTILRPNGFMQNLVIYNAGTINTQNAFYGSQGEAKVSHIDLRDVAAVAVKVLTEDGHTGYAYTLTGPEAITNARIAEILSGDVGREIKYVDLPDDKLKQALLAAGVPEWTATATVDLQRFYREGGASAVSKDVEELLGRKPIRFEQFSRDYRTAFQRAAA
jgi:uncharacterized protein YbjT (DUF2867 family)